MIFRATIDRSPRPSTGFQHRVHCHRGGGGPFASVLSVLASTSYAPRATPPNTVSRTRYRGGGVYGNQECELLEQFQWKKFIPRIRRDAGGGDRTGVKAEDL